MPLDAQLNNAAFPRRNEGILREYENSDNMQKYENYVEHTREAVGYLPQSGDHKFFSDADEAH